MKSFRDLLNQVSVPGRYLPLEFFASRKDPASARLKVCLAFPDLYEVGMSHLGLRILYHLLNEKEGIACERVYAPALDLEALLRAERIPLGSLESGTPLGEFDILGFSLAYELGYTNVLNILDLAGIPLRAADRRAGKWPLIIGGGPVTANPEPIAPFFDAFLFGDGEEAVLELAREVTAWKERSGSREELLERLSGLEGLYIPEYFEPEYEADGRVKRVRALKPGPEKVKRRIVADLAKAYFPSRPLVPLLEPVHDRVMIEVMRGCSRGCRFCQAGILYRPVRERSGPEVLRLARESLAATGYEECSLLALSAGDYSGLSEVLLSLLREHYDSRVSVSLPSLRVQGLSDPLLKAIESVRKTGFTLAPEAGTDRLRRVINKAYSEDELLETARRVFAHGWRNLKLYFMAGLPTETDADVAGILQLGDEVSRLRGAQGRPQVSLSVSGFVPKAHTPFQWESQVSSGRLREIHDRLRREFSGRGRRVKWQDPRMSELEGVFSRGDRRLAPALLIAFQKGRRFDGWSEHFRFEEWSAALAESGLSPEFYTARQRDRDEVFPWDHLDSGASREWLWEERERAYAEALTPDCRLEGCVRSCGVCDHRAIQPRLSARAGEETMTGPAPERRSEAEIFFLYRFQYARRGVMRFIGQLEVNRLFSRAVRRAGLPMRYSQGYHPLPRMMFGPPPPVGVASEAEFLDLELARRLPPETIKEKLQAAMPEGLVILSADEMPMRTSPISAVITGFDYEVQPPEGSNFSWDRDRIADFLAQESVVIKQKREKGDREVDLRTRVRGLEAGEDGRLRMGLRVAEGPGVKPQEVVAHVFGLSETEIRDLLFTRVAARIKTAQPVRFPGRGERTRKVRK